MFWEEPPGIRLISSSGDEYVAATQTEANRLVLGHGYRAALDEPKVDIMSPAIDTEYEE